MQSNTFVAIMAGGVGSRFWPASRTSCPKQFLDILGVGKSLLQMTYDRFLKVCPAENIFIVTNKQYVGLVKEHLPALSDNQILGEPSRNNTAPCVAYTALKLQALNPDANLIIAPSDHVIQNDEEFVRLLEKGLAFTATHQALLTLGIKPSRPDTGYGYIQFEETPLLDEIHEVKRFAEKPPLEKAKAYLESGDYLWNAGIFIWRVSTLLDAYQRYAPEIYEILAKPNAPYNTAEEQAFIDLYYPTTPDISVDYAIMEKAENVYTMPSEFGWSDLGTWASLHAEGDKDDSNNVTNGSNAILLDTKDCLVRTPAGKLIILKDLEGYIVVDEGDVLMVYPKSKEQEVKEVTKLIRDRVGDDLL